MNFPSLQQLVDNRVLSCTMTKKNAVSGLNFHLELPHKSPDGTNVLFTEVHDGSIRDTRSKKIIESIVEKCFN